MFFINNQLVAYYDYWCKCLTASGCCSSPKKWYTKIKNIMRTPIYVQYEYS